jgi:hypothetical protein
MGRRLLTFLPQLLVLFVVIIGTVIPQGALGTHLPKAHKDINPKLISFLLLRYFLQARRRSQAVEVSLTHL